MQKIRILLAASAAALAFQAAPALAERGSMFDPGPCVYMQKMAGGPEIADCLDLDRPIAETLRLVAQKKSCDIRDVMVVVLDRPRHQDGIREIREAGAQRLD